MHFSREIPEICPRNICGCQVIQAVTFKRDGEWKRDPNSQGWKGDLQRSGIKLGHGGLNHLVKIDSHK